MNNRKKIKIIIGLFYLVLVFMFLYFFLSKFTLEELTSYEFIKNNRDYFFDLKKTNLILLSCIFLLATILWVFAAGFGMPISILGGFIFGKWVGTFYVVIGMSLGATLLYIFSNYFLKEFVKEKFLKKFKNLEYNFKKSEFNYLLLYRLIGGVPFALSNILPCIFNVKVTNFFWSTIIGLVPQIFLIVSIGSGLEKIIDQNLEAPKIKDLIYSPDIFIPVLAFLCLLIVTIVVRKVFYKN